MGFSVECSRPASAQPVHACRSRGACGRMPKSQIWVVFLVVAGTLFVAPWRVSASEGLWPAGSGLAWGLVLQAVVVLAMAGVGPPAVACDVGGCVSLHARGARAYRRHVCVQVYLCERCGWAHVCGDACTEDATGGASELRVCPISGRCFDKLVVDWGEARATRRPVAVGFRGVRTLQYTRSVTCRESTAAN